MTYTPTTWSDEVPQTTPVKYTIRTSAGAIIYDDVQIDIKTTVTPGTSVNAANLNKIEQGIVTLENATIPKAFLASGDLFIGSGNGSGARLFVAGGDGVLTNDDVQFTNRVGWVFPAAAFARGSAGGTIPNATETIVDFSTISNEIDAGGILAFTTGANWKCTVAKAGIYLIHTAVCFQLTTNWAEGEIGMLSLFKNGSLHARLMRRDNYSSANSQMWLSGSILAILAANDYVDIRVYQGSGGSLSLVADGNQNWFAIAKIR